MQTRDDISVFSPGNEDLDFKHYLVYYLQGGNGIKELSRGFLRTFHSVGHEGWGRGGRSPSTESSKMLKIFRMCETTWSKWHKGHGISGVNSGSPVIEVTSNLDCYFAIYTGEASRETTRKVSNMAAKYGLFCFLSVLLVSSLFVSFGLQLGFTVVYTLLVFSLHSFHVGRCGYHQCRRWKSR